MNDRYYKLVGRTPILVDMHTWARSEEPTPHIGLDELGGVTVSTVFLGLDHNFFDEGPPILFETMIFGGIHDGDMRRCSTYSQAEKMHAEEVAKVKRSISISAKHGWIKT
jgi:hypothetical protein